MGLFMLGSEKDSFSLKFNINIEKKVFEALLKYWEEEIALDVEIEKLIADFNKIFKERSDNLESVIANDKMSDDILKKELAIYPDQAKLVIIFQNIKVRLFEGDEMEKITPLLLYKQVKILQSLVKKYKEINEEIGSAMDRNDKDMVVQKNRDAYKLIEEFESRILSVQVIIRAAALVIKDKSVLDNYEKFASVLTDVNKEFEALFVKSQKGKNAKILGDCMLKLVSELPRKKILPLQSLRTFDKGFLSVQEGVSVDKVLSKIISQGVNAAKSVAYARVLYNSFQKLSNNVSELLGNYGDSSVFSKDEKKRFRNDMKFLLGRESNNRSI
jgi:hypothetical protein